LPQDMHQALISHTDIAAIRNYKNTCKKLYENVHFHMASDYTIANMTTVTCLRGLIAFAQQQDQMRVKEKDSTCNNIQNNFMRFLSRSGIKEYLTTELVLQRIGSRMTMVLNKACLFSGISIEAGEQKTLFKNNDAQDIATKLILYAKHYEPSNMHNNECPLLINIFKSYKKNLLPLLLAHPRVDVNLQDKYGNTALMIACVGNSIEVVKVLLADSRVNVNLQDKWGKAALMEACTHNYIEIVKQLLADSRFNVNLQDKWGKAALMEACTSNYIEIVKQLLADPNININLQNKFGETALMEVCTHNYIEVVKVLLADSRVNVNLQDKWGNTALMEACTRNSIEVVKALIADPNINVNLQNQEGYTALMRTCKQNNIEVVKILLAHQYMWPLDKIIYNLYLKYGLSAITMATIAVLVGKGIVVSSLLLGLLYYAH